METTVLLFTALATSTLSGVLGMGGGVLLLAVMAQYFPLTELIPLHGLIQLGSNLARAAFSYHKVDRNLTWQFGVGAMIGAILGANAAVGFPENWYKLALGVFVLILTFVPLPRFKGAIHFKWPLVGGVATFLGTFVGATGPLIAPFYLSENLKRDALISTKAACQSFLHFFKVLAFFALGFSLLPHLQIVVGMAVMSVIGTYLGKRFLERLPEKWFVFLFKLVIVALSGRMIWQGLSSLL